MGETAGFTNPEMNVSGVEVVAKPAPGLFSGQEAVAYGHSGGVSGAVLESDSMTSIALLALFSLIRIYFCIIVMSYARSLLRQHVASTSSASAGYSDGSSDSTMAENPFRVGREEGAGWQGKLGRLMLRFPSKRYWLGREEMDSQREWERATSGRFESGRKLHIKVPGQDGGVGERERRARSGTGPPPPVGKKVPE